MVPNEKDEFKLIEETCEGCGKVFETFCDWDSWHPVERPKHFYCSEECYFEAIGFEAKREVEGQDRGHEGGGYGTQRSSKTLGGAKK